MQRTSIARARRVALTLVVALATLAAVAPQGQAILPPSNCGTLAVKGKRYMIKSDQLRCATARKHSRRYLATRSRPRGYSCRDYGAQTKLKFRCSRGVKVFFAIRR